MPSRNSVTCLPSLSTMASLPTRSMRLTWLSRFTRISGQFSRAATCSMWVDLRVLLGEGRHLHVEIDVEGLLRGNLPVWREGEQLVFCGVERSHGAVRLQ